MIICADDYGLSRPINEAILTLADQNRITAATCMVTNEFCEESLTQLRAVKKDLDIGLHFVLSEERPLLSTTEIALVQGGGNFLGFSALTRLVYFKKVDAQLLRAEMQAQLDKFCDLYGEYPDFLDGHQHVHQLPQIRDVFVEICRKLGEKKKIYARVSAIPGRRIYKDLRDPALALASMGIALQSRGLAARLDSAGVRRNRNLWGYHRYNQPRDIAKVFQAALAGQAAANDVFFCHPGSLLGDARDTLAIERRECFEFLRSQEFIQLLKTSGQSLNRFFTG